MRPFLWGFLIAIGASGCGDDDGPMMTADAGPMPGTDSGRPDAQPASLAHCDFEPLPPTGHAGGTVTAGALTAGAAEVMMELPVGSALGSYTARSSGLGAAAGVVDSRFVEIAGGFNSSVGVETRMKIKVLVLTAGGETVVLVKLDLGYPYEGMTVAVEEMLGPDFQGKVFIGCSHSHSAWGHYSANEVYQLGSAQFRRRTFDTLVSQIVEATRAAIAAQEPAMIGIVHDGMFDTDDRITRDRRGENDMLAGGSRDDRDFFMIRVDAADGSPIAMLPIFGIHGTIQGEDNNLSSTDAPGAIERALEEQFDEPVLVMHLQGAGGDVSPAGTGGTNSGPEVSYNFARAETVGRYAVEPIMAQYAQAGMAMTGETTLEMVSRSVPLGPDWRTFRVREGDRTLEYAPWDGVTDCDTRIYDEDGSILSPIDEFNAPFGAGLCGTNGNAIFPMAQLPGTERAWGMCPGDPPRGCTSPYRSCMSIPVVAEAIEAAVGLPFTEYPVCQTARTTISAFRIGDFMFAAFPGEPVTLWADLVRSFSPFPPENTVVLGYAHGEVGYLMTVDDWLMGGYEPSINLWGPLEGEYLAERARDLMEMAASAEREDANAEGADVWVTPDIGNDIPPPDPAPMAGTVPASIPGAVYVRNDVVLPSAQPAPMIRRLESAYFVFIGEDPLSGTPTVTLERETSPGMFAPVTRRSGREVSDGDILVLWTPLPLIREGTNPRTHYWVVEWQAVTPWGTPMLDDLEDRPGIPAGRYRFHVDGTGYELDSDAFEVVPAELSVSATRAGTRIDATVSYHAPSGFRLLHLTTNSNDPIPLVRGPATAILQPGGVMVDATVMGDGHVIVDHAAAAAATRVTIRDRFGNEGSVDL